MLTSIFSKPSEIHIQRLLFLFSAAHSKYSNGKLYRSNYIHSTTPQPPSCMSTSIFSKTPDIHTQRLLFLCSKTHSEHSLGKLCTSIQAYTLFICIPHPLTYMLTSVFSKPSEIHILRLLFSLSKARSKHSLGNLYTFSHSLFLSTPQLLARLFTSVFSKPSEIHILRLLFPFSPTHSKHYLDKLYTSKFILLSTPFQRAGSLELASSQWVRERHIHIKYRQTFFF